MNAAADLPPVISPPTRGVTRWVWLLGAGLVAGLAVLYCFNPVEYHFYPTCQFYQLTHLHCPGCGSLRALHQLTHGHLGAAFHSNPLLVAALPFAAWLGFSAWHSEKQRLARRAWLQPAAAWTLLGILIVFGILRNLPGPAFAWMSP